MHNVPIDFDFISNRPKLKSPQELYEFIESAYVQFHGHDQELHLVSEFEKEYDKRGFAHDNGVAILNIKSAQVMNKFIGFVRLAKPFDFHASDGELCDLIGIVVSPAFHGGLHLRRLARMSRLLKDKSFTAKLRDAENEEVLSILLKDHDDFLEHKAA